MKYAVVTGGTSGMGLGVAKMLINKGYYVYVTYVGPDFTEQIDNFEAIKCDQTNREEVYKFINYIKCKTDHLDCLHCNAGMSIRKSFTDYDDKDWDAMMEVAVNSHYIMCREFFPIIPKILPSSNSKLIPFKASNNSILFFGLKNVALIEVFFSPL